ncbi:MAG: carboxypeptidase regulatory-like domain-containing protein [Lacunisphaera sp.]|nr:carboxypeptidase regulatory-like domain-containing protein [Lacunisphaera sp.]
MEISPAKLTLIVLASIIVGIAIAIVSFFAWMYMAVSSDTPATISIGGAAKEKTVASISLEQVEPGYLGTSNMTWGERPHLHDAPVLAEGDARIVGTAIASGRPVSGLRLRLALNRKAKSAWAVTDKDGRYEILVPSGRYEVSGFEFDSFAADKVLAGMIMHPSRMHFGMRDVAAMDVAPDRPGKGIEFLFTPPVVVTDPVGEVASGTPVLLRWKPYPGATDYRVQLNETPGRNHVGSVEQVFPWEARPKVKSAPFDVAAAGGSLKPGHYYSIQIEALNEKGEVISENATNYRLGQFKIAETANK